MQKRKFTVVTQLHDKNNSQIIEYVENSRATYAHAMRKTFQHIKLITHIYKINTVLLSVLLILLYLMHKDD